MVDSLATYLVNVAVGDVHLLGALTMRRDNLSDDNTISGEDYDERDEISEKRVDPIPGTDVELPELVVDDAVGGVAVWFDDVKREEEVHVCDEEQDDDGGPDVYDGGPDGDDGGPADDDDGGPDADDGGPDGDDGGPADDDGGLDGDDGGPYGDDGGPADDDGGPDGDNTST